MSAYFVLRTHSYTDKQRLWKVLSRPIANRNDADVWLEVEKGRENNPKHEYFVVYSSMDDDANFEHTDQKKTLELKKQLEGKETALHQYEEELEVKIQENAKLKQRLKLTNKLISDILEHDCMEAHSIIYYALHTTPKGGE
jgi:vacuolar-type H+-ATPase subunit I/STV1